MFVRSHRNRGIALVLGAGLVVAAATQGCASTASGAADRATDSGSQKDRGGPLEEHEGLLTFFTDAVEGKVWLRAPQVREQFIYVEGLRSGLGSNPVGLDRGELGDSRLIEMRRVGGRLLILQPNLRFRADTGTAAEETAVAESFASSVLWAGPIDRQRLGGEELVDLTSFLIRDGHDVSGRLRWADQGSFKLDPARSVVDLEACLAFPDNIEFEAILTFAGEAPGALVRETTPDPTAVTLIQHYSLIRLPAPGYRPRRFDARAGSFEIQFADYAAPLEDTIERRWIVRHRLEKQDPTAERSAAVEPLVYYVDPAIPEPIRQAVLDGAGWWAAAFEAAGFVDAFRVELLPAEVHPLDARYNVVQWVHRSTRGWSYGGGIVDPRTGELVKGHVRLGSLRVRQDRLLFEGLAGTSRTGTGSPDDPVQLSLARIRQLAAHEVGHTLGLSHNFAASTYGGRASVMDYPAPLVRIGEDGELDFSDAYGVGVGAWDVQAIRYAYSTFPEGSDESVELDRLVEAGLARNLVFLTDEDARPPGAAHPLANLWDNGSDPIAQLELELEVRRLALDRFGEDNVLPGTPLALLEEVLVPLFLHHRYQLEATVKVIGGVDYRYSLRGDSQPVSQPLPAAEQRRALDVVLRTLEPAFLDLPDRVLDLLVPRPAGYSTNREMFAGQSAPIFDPLAVAATAADATLRALLQRERAARLIDAHRRDPGQPGFDEVMGAIERVVFGTPTADPRLAAISRRIQTVAVVALIDLADDAAASPAVRAQAEASLLRVMDLLASPPDGDAEAARLERLVARYLERVATAGAEPAAAAEMPPGQPIGGVSGVTGWSACSW